ncbi:MAG TPA: anti-sigma factor [Candidatus Cybelea sp.]|nr:anti-sigma factor [Candidatus Cybelea sp.]
MTNGHPTREEDFDLYALGALEGGERQVVEAHVAVCADCARKLAEARGRVAMLAFAAPRVEASPLAKERLMARVRAETAPARRATTAPDRHGGRRETESDVTRGRLFNRWWAVALTPVAVALVFATILLWRQNEGLDRELANERQSLASLQREIEEAHHAADLLAARDTVVVPLMPMPGMGKGMGRVTYNAHMGMLMYDGDLAPTAAGKSYQLWLMPMHGAPINAGVFNPKPGQVEHWMIELPAGVAPKEFAVTLEPAGGMPHPTGPKVLAGAVA